MFFRSANFLRAAVAAAALSGLFPTRSTRDAVEPTPRSAPPPAAEPPAAPAPMPAPVDEREAAAERRRAVAARLAEPSPPAAVRTFVGQSREAERRRRQAARIAARKAATDA